MRILLLGCNGQVGWELQRALAPLGDVIACDFDTAGDRRADFTQPQTLPALFARVAPQLVVNAAAHTAVDRAESEPDVAQTINATAPAVLARECARAAVPIVHYGTDYVFDGSGDAPRDEDAATAPLSVYGRSKRDGEQAIRESGAAHLILRTSWVYAARGGNFVRTMLRLAAERETLSVVDDQVGAPTGAELLADVTAHVVRRLLADSRVGGTYHCTAAGETSWCGYARFVVGWAQAHGHALKAGADAIRPVATADYPTPAQRPLNSRLDTSRLQRTFGLTLPPWQRGVERLLAEILPSPAPLAR